MNFHLKKGTHKIKFKHPLPRRVFINFNGQNWIDRKLDGKTDTISFNTLRDGLYSSPNGFDIVESKPLVKPEERIELYEPERDREKPIVIVYNPKLGPNDTPARIFTNMNPARIEVGQRFYTFPPQVRFFILLHEYGHLFYQDEHKTDLYALKKYISEGYNISQAMNALIHVLKPNDQNFERIQKLYNELKENNYVKS